MLRSLLRDGPARNRGILVALVGILMMSLVACSGPSADPSPGSSGTPEETAEVSIGSFIRRVLAPDAPGAPRWRHHADGDGYIPDGEAVSPYDTDHPAIANLDPALLEAVQLAAEDARHDGIEIRVSSGWRSASYQQSLLDEAVARYGLEEARRRVNLPEQSTHVTGHAVDIAPMDAMSWLSQYGSWYGLCQTYANELWHYELMTEPGGTCPEQLPDAAAG